MLEDKEKDKEGNVKVLPCKFLASVEDYVIIKVATATATASQPELSPNDPDVRASNSSSCCDVAGTYDESSAATHCVPSSSSTSVNCILRHCPDAQVPRNTLT